MKNRQVNTNKAPVMYPLGVAQSGSVDVNPLARSSPKVTKFQLIKPKQEPSLKTSPKIIIKAEPLKIQSPTKLTSLGSSVVKMEISSLQHYPPPFIPKSILSINQNSNSKRNFNKPSIKFSPYSQNTFPPTTMIPMDAGLFKIDIVKTEDTQIKVA